MSLTLVGVNHKTAPVDLRERLAIPKDDEAQFLEELREASRLRGVSLISTCNRVEVIASSEDEDVIQPIVDILAERGEIAQDDLEEHLYILRHRDVIRHMFRLASGLESMIVGEPQIAGQVKDSYLSGKRLQTLDSTLYSLYEQTLHVAKVVRTETAIGQLAVSVPFAAVELARKIFGELEGLRALLLGAGDMGELTAEHLRGQGLSEMLVSNRSAERAESLAERFGGRAIPFEGFESTLHEVDIVIGSTAAPDFVVTRAHAERAMKSRRRDLFLIDLSVPRNIDPAIGDLDGVYLYNVDDLEEIANRNREKRLEEAAEADRIIEKEIESFLGHLAAQDAVPTIVELQEHLDAIRRRELEKCLRKMGPITAEQRQLLEGMTKGIINKVAHYPIVRLRESSIDQGPGETIRETIRRIFGLR